MGPNIAWWWNQRLKNENLINSNVNINEENPYVIHDQSRGIENLKMEENTIKDTKDEKMQKEKTSKKVGKTITYIGQCGEVQHCLPSPPPEHIITQDPLKEEKSVGTNHKNNDSTYLYEPHPVKRMKMIHNILEKAELDENTDIDKTEKTYIHLSSKPSTHENGFQLPETKMSKQNPENNIRKNYLGLVHGRLIGLKIRDVSKTKTYR